MATDSLNFHQTFPPEQQHLSNLLQNAEAIQNKDALKISQITGIPQGESSGKVRPHFSYAQYMGLLNYSYQSGTYSVALTDLGECVRKDDPWMQEELTALLCHSMIVREHGGAPMWSQLFLNILPKYRGEVSIDVCCREMAKIFDSNEVTIRKQISPLLTSYSENGFFGTTGILKKSNDTLALQPLDYQPDFAYLYAYCLYDFWDADFPGENEILRTQLEKTGFRHVFGWSLSTELSVLEHLADMGIIRMNRQLTPPSIARLSAKSDLIDNLYSLLC